MRATVDQFKNGIAKYIDNEITAKVNGFGKWLIPLAGASIINCKVEPMIKDNHELLMHMGYMTEDGLIGHLLVRSISHGLRLQLRRVRS